MSALISPATLQQICEGAATAWLMEWAGLVGQVSARAATNQSQRSCCSKQESQNPLPLLPQRYRADGPALCSPSCSCLTYSRQRVHASSQEANCQERSIKKRSKSSCYKKKSRKVNRDVAIQYDSDVSCFHNERNEAVFQECFWLEEQTRISALINTQNSECMSPRVSFTEHFEKNVINLNVTHCSDFLRRYVPPLLTDQLFTSAWKQLSSVVAIQSFSDPIQEYQVKHWVRRASVLLLLASEVSKRKFPLNISAIPASMLEDILEIINRQFPLEMLNTFVLPKTDFRKSPVEFSSTCKSLYKSILQRTSITSMILNCDLCDDDILRTLSQLPLKELVISGSLVSEKGVVNGLCDLPIETASDLIDIISSGNLHTYPKAPLRKSLQKLDVSFQNISNHSVYYVIPAIFSELLYYNPHRNMVQCLQNYERLTSVQNRDNETTDSNNSLKLLNINMGCPDRYPFTEIAKICPLLQEVSLIIDMDAEEILPALENFKHLSHLDVTYYPASSSSLPKIDARVLLSTLTKFKSQLKALSLTGFHISGTVFYELSQLPELCQLSLEDCWLSNPRNIPVKPFPSLEELRLKFLPPKSTMQFLTMGTGIQNLYLDLKESEWEGNALTDASVKHLVTSGMVRSLQNFTALSSSLSLTSLRCLAALPYLKTVGKLASWGLTKDELRCVDHSGPQHILCIR